LREEDLSTLASTETTTFAHTGARLRRWGALLGVLLVVILILGSSWDGDWHGRVGRDSFWIPPHLMMYSSITLFGLVALGITVWTTLNEPRDASGMLRLFGLQAPLGVALMGIGVVVALLAAPFDDLWHRTFGIDVSVWSPPHFTGWAGFIVSLIGVQIAIVQEWPGLARGWQGVPLLGQVAFMLAAGGVLRHTTVATLPGASYSFWQSDTQLNEVHIIHPFLFALAASLFMVPAITAIRRVAGRRGLVMAVAGLLTLAALCIVFVEILTPILRESLGHAWRTTADDTSTRDLFLFPALFTALPALSALLSRPEHGARIGAAAGLLYWFQLAIYLASIEMLEVGPAAGGLALCVGIGAVMGWAGSRTGGAIKRISEAASSAAPAH
jgi:hypothetical protein